MMIKKLYMIPLLIACSFAASAQNSVDYDTSAADGSETSTGVTAVTLTLEDCRERALSDNVYARNAQLDVRAAWLQKREALWEYFPRVSAMAAGYWAHDPLVEISAEDILGENSQALIASMSQIYGINTSFSGFEKGWGAAVHAIQPVFAGGRIVNGNRLAAVGLEAAQLRLDIQNRKTVNEVEDIWWQGVSLQDKLETLDYLDATLDTLYSNLSNAVSAGLSADTETLQLELKRNELAASRKKVESGIRLCKMNLLNAIGMEYSATRAGAGEGRPYLDDIELDTYSQLPLSPENYWRDAESAVMQMDETQLLALQVKAKRLEKKMAVGEALPELAVGVGAGYYDLNEAGKSNALAFATVKVPLSDWGKTARKAQRLETEVQKAVNESDYLQDQLRLQMDRLWLDVTSAYDQWQLAEQSLRTSQRLYDVSLANYSAGLIPLQELLDAETTLRTDSSSRCDRLIEYRTAVREYLAM